MKKLIRVLFVLLAAALIFFYQSGYLHDFLSHSELGSDFLC